MTDRRSVYTLFQEWRSHLNDERRTRVLKEQEEDDFDFDAPETAAAIRKQRTAKAKKSQLEPIESQTSERYKKDKYKKRMRAVGKTLKTRNQQINVTPQYTYDRRKQLRYDIIKYAMSDVLKKEEIPSNWDEDNLKLLSFGIAGADGTVGLNNLPPNLYKKVIKGYFDYAGKIDDLEYDNAVRLKKNLSAYASWEQDTGGLGSNASAGWKKNPQLQAAWNNHTNKVAREARDYDGEGKYSLGRSMKAYGNWTKPTVWSAISSIRSRIDRANRQAGNKYFSGRISWSVLEKYGIEKDQYAALKNVEGLDSDRGIFLPNDDQISKRNSLQQQAKMSKTIAMRLQRGDNWDWQRGADGIPMAQSRDGVEVFRNMTPKSYFENWMRQKKESDATSLNTNLKSVAESYIDHKLVTHITKVDKYDRAVKAGATDLKKPELNISNIFGGGRGAFKTDNSRYKKQLDAAETRRKEAAAESARMAKIPDWTGIKTTAEKEAYDAEMEADIGAAMARGRSAIALDSERKSKYGDDYKSKGSFLRRYKKVGENFNFAEFYDLVDEHGVNKKLGRYGKTKDGKDFRFGRAHARALKALVSKSEETGKKLPQSIIDAHSAISSGKSSSSSRKRPKIKGLKPPVPKAPAPVKPLPAATREFKPVASKEGDWTPPKGEKPATPPAPVVKKPKFKIDAITGKKVQVDANDVPITENKTVKDIYANWKNFLS